MELYWLSKYTNRLSKHAWSQIGIRTNGPIAGKTIYIVSQMVSMARQTIQTTWQTVYTSMQWR